MGRPAKFTFIPTSQIENPKEAGMIVSYNIQGSILIFSKKYYKVKELVGKFVRFYVDLEKKTLAWRFIDEKEFGELKDYREIKETGRADNGEDSSIIKVSVPSSVIGALKLTTEYKTNKLEVGRYQTEGYLTQDDFYYITFEKK